MAGYAGARPRTGLLGRRVAPAPRDLPADPRAATLPRRRVRAGTASRARRRSGQTGLIAAGIVIAFGLAFVSLAQTVKVSAGQVELDQLNAEYAILEAEQAEIRSDLYRLGREPAVRKQALDAGLGQLVNPLVLPAR
jgi:hypothetical protein